MTRKIANDTDPGTSTIWGADDADYINKYLTGVDQSATDPVTIATTTKYANTKLQINNPAASFQYIVNTSAITATRNITLPLLGADDTFVFNGNTATLTNKTLTSPVISTISNTGTLTLPTSTDTLTGRATTDTLTNKTINATNNTITDTSAAVGDILTVVSGTKFTRLAIGTANQVLSVNGTATGLAWTTGGGGGGTFNRGKATFSPNGSSTTFTIAHGLGATPTSISVVPGSTIAGQGQNFPGDHEGPQVWYTADATNITVNWGGTAPPSGTNTLVYWWVAFA